MNEWLMGEEIEWSAMLQSGKSARLLVDNDVHSIIGLFKGPSDITGLSRCFLKNGAAVGRETIGEHVETATPECSGPRDILIYDKWCEFFVASAAEEAAERGWGRLIFHKKNSDADLLVPHSRGCHESYLTSRNFANRLIGADDDSKTLDGIEPAINALILFLITRQIFSGSGGLMLFPPDEASSERPSSFWISPRTYFITHIFEANTSDHRGIINTRNEPLAVMSRYGRLHLILGDANMADMSVYLKFGATAAVLEMIDTGYLDDQIVMKELDRAVELIKKISADLTLKSVPIKLKSGRVLNAIGVQRIFQEIWKSYVSKNKCGGEKLAVAEYWGEVLDLLEKDSPELNYWLDWKLKHTLIDAYRRKTGLPLDHNKVRAFELSYHSPERKKSCYYRFKEEAGARFKSLVSPEEIISANEKPPRKTRARVRARLMVLLEKLGLPHEIYWDHVAFNKPGHLATPFRYLISFGEPLTYSLKTVLKNNGRARAFLKKFMSRR